MEEQDVLDTKISDEVGRFAETYSSFNKIINRIQRQYLSLKDTYTKQSRELQNVNETLQSMMKENRAVTEFLNSILNSLSSGVIAVDRDGMISHMNPAARRIFDVSDDKYSRGRLSYPDVIEAIENEDCSALSAVKQGKGNQSGEKKIRTPYGKILTLFVSTSPLYNRSGEIIGAVELFNDITKLKAMEEQLSQMKVLASLGEMAASIAHEIRNPLVAVGGFASLLARDLDDDPVKRDMAKKIVEGVESINSIIQTLLDFARREKIEKSRVDLNAYLKVILDDFKKESELCNINGGLEMSLPPNVSISVELDRQLFRQAFHNIIKNGLEVDGKSTDLKVKISTRRLSRKEAFKRYGDRIELSGTETLAEIIIEDNGPGIPEENIDKLFSPFHSTKENGIGLGLSIAWKIVKAHGGDIMIESKLGKGTRFSIIMPVSTE